MEKLLQEYDQRIYQMSLDDLNDVEDIVDEGDVYCTIMSRRNAVRVRSLHYACLSCSIRIESQKNMSGGCCGDGNNYFTIYLKKFHQHLDMHRSRGEAVPEEYYEMRTQK